MNIPSEVVAQFAVSEGIVYNKEELQAFANAIAKWQHEKDAELCGNIKKFYTKHYELGAGECAESILKQGEE